MHKPVGIVSIDTSLNSISSCDHYLASCGGNAGNLLFTSSVFSHFHNPIRIGFSLRRRIDELNSQLHGIVIPAANWIDCWSDWGFLADAIEKVTIPIVCVGLGSQLSISDALAGHIKPGTIRFLQALSRKSTIIGTRGTETSSILSHLGIVNSMPMGCPSVFLGLRMPKSAELPVTPKNLRLSMSQTRYELYDDLARSQMFLARLAARKASSIVLQSERAELMALLDDDISAHSSLASYYDVPLGAVNSLLSKLRIFKTADEWISFHRSNTDFTISSRIHGCIASLLAGKPALLIHHDVRTLELAETMGVSTISLEMAKRNSRLLFGRRLVTTRFLRSHYSQGIFLRRAATNLKTLLMIYRTCGFSDVLVA